MRTYTIIEEIEGFIETLRADGEPVPEETEPLRMLTIHVAA
jgi:hypothetical protein